MANRFFSMVASALLLRSVLAIDLEDQEVLHLLQKTNRLSRPIAQSDGEKGCGGRGLFVAYLSAVSNHQRRSAVRQKCLPDLKDHDVPYRFFIGRPHFPEFWQPETQGSISTPEEIKQVKLLREEQDQHADLHMLPFLDQYKDLSDKTINIFQYGLKHCYDLVLKIDDDMCPNVTALQPLLEASTRGEALYDGLGQLGGNEYTIMKGADGSRVSYMAGPCYALSRAMAFTIFEKDGFDTVLWQDYGTSSEDNNMGRWVEHAKARFGDKLQVTQKTVRNLCHDFPREHEKKEESWWGWWWGSCSAAAASIVGKFEGWIGCIGRLF